MTKQSFNSHLRLVHAHRTTSHRQCLDDSPLDHPVAEPQRPRRLGPGLAAKPRLGNTAWKRLENASQA
jgi:hypothetical protein